MKKTTLAIPPRARREKIFVSQFNLILLAGTLSTGLSWVAVRDAWYWCGVKPPPDHANVRYGPSPQNVLDLWSAASNRPTPWMVFFHSGGFRRGNKSDLPPGFLKCCLRAGILAASVDYRLSGQAPFPAPMRDGARAIQFLRARADEWNLDPARGAAAGDSAGGGMSLWLGFHADLAEPESADPIARQSTRLACMGVIGAQTSYDLRFIQREIGGRTHEHPALLPFLGLKPAELATPRAARIFAEASPLSYVSANAPPVFMFYFERRLPLPLPPDTLPKVGIHHLRFGEVLKQRLDALHVECVLRRRKEYKVGAGEVMDCVYEDMVQFFLAHFAKQSTGAERPHTQQVLAR